MSSSPNPPILEPGALAIFHSFPNEILGDIFLWTTPTMAYFTNSEPRKGSFDVRLSPWKLGHVSRHWRAVALTTPSLWTVLVIIQHQLCPFLMLETQLHRASNHFLYISFRRAANLYTVKLLEILMTAAPRWRELHLGLVGELYEEECKTLVCMRLLSTARRRLHSLRTLFLNVSVPPGMVWGAFGVAENLRYVALLDGMQPPQLPLAQLTHLAMQDHTSRMPSILRAATSLLVLKLWAWGAATSSPELDLPRLRELHSNSACIACIVAPQLTRFCASGRGTVAYLLPLMERSKCTLTTLSIMPDLEAGDTELLLTLLAKTPELTRLDINFSHAQFGEAAAVSTLLARLRPPLLPNLQTLGLDLSRILAVDQSAAVDMIESWWRVADRRLQHIGLRFHESWNEDTLARMGLLKQEGLELVDAAKSWYEIQWL
ncbi:hypothetical protein DFH06DRAFT_511789 [Mycena polygramma]|nr:hypothetical protein DFH06DRAFT_511789 [Mycena polygramma]